MKTKFLALMLAVTGLDLWAQTPPLMPQLPAASTPPAGSAPPQINRSRLPRYGAAGTNAAAPPRYATPQTTADAAAASAATAPGAATADSAKSGAPGTSGTTGTSASRAAAMTGIVAGADEPVPTIHFEGVEVNQVLNIYAKYVGRTLLRAGLPESKITLDTSATPLTKGEMIQALQAVLALNGISVINVGEKFVKVLPSDQANTAAGEIDRSGSTNLPSLGSYVTHIVQLKYIKPSEIDRKSVV